MQFCYYVRTSYYLNHESFLYFFDVYHVKIAKAGAPTEAPIRNGKCQFNQTIGAKRYKISSKSNPAIPG